MADKKYQSKRQFYFNPTFAGLSGLSVEQVYNPNTVITSVLKDQQNIIRFENQVPFFIKNSDMLNTLLGSKSGIILNDLIFKLFKRDTRNEILMETAGYGDYFALVTIKNYPNFNLSDYEMLVFDEDGFLISNFESAAPYVVNGTLYIVLRNCSKYVTDTDGTTKKADKVNVVFLKRINRKDEVLMALTNWNNAGGNSQHSTLTDDIATTHLEDKYYVNFANISNDPNTNILWKNYSTEYYGLMMYIAKFNLPDDIKGYLKPDQQVNAQSDIDFNLKNNIIIPENKYSVSREGESIVFSTNNASIESLDITFICNSVYKDASYPPNDNLDWTSDNRLKVKLTAVNGYKMYAYNKATCKMAEFSYYYNGEDNGFCVSFADSTNVNREAILNAFMPILDNDNTKLLGYAPAYIPLVNIMPSLINIDDEYIYTKLMKPEEILIWIDGVKLTPYEDYNINYTNVGKDFPLGSIVFRNEEISDSSAYGTTDFIARDFPAVDTEEVTKHNIRILSVPPYCGRNFYFGPHIEDDVIVDTELSDYAGTVGVRDSYFPVVKMDSHAVSGYDLERDGMTVSCLNRNSILTFNAGRYVQSINTSDSTILDNTIHQDLKTYKQVEIRSYFDDDLNAGLNSFVDDTTETFKPLIENVLSILSVTKDSYISKFCEENGINAIDASTAEKIGLSSSWIADSLHPMSLIELWLKRNALLKYRVDMYSGDNRRVTERQTRFSASDDLSIQGYLGNIRVLGNGTYGLADITATTDVYNEDVSEEDTTNGG